jgi:hypothetical protein
MTNDPIFEKLSIDFEAPFNGDSASLNLNFLLPQTDLDLEIIGSCREFILSLCSSEFHICIHWTSQTNTFVS